MSDIRWGNVSLDVLEESGNIRMDSSEDNGCMANVDKWPRNRRETVDGSDRMLWHHSDIKNLAYFFVYQLV